MYSGYIHLTPSVQTNCLRQEYRNIRASGHVTPLTQNIVGEPTNKTRNAQPYTFQSVLSNIQLFFLCILKYVMFHSLHALVKLYAFVINIC